MRKKIGELRRLPISLELTDTGLPSRTTERHRAASCRAPAENIGSGGHSLLVGYDGLSADVPAVQAMPLFGPPMQLPPEQSGQGWMPPIVADGSVDVSPVR